MINLIFYFTVFIAVISFIYISYETISTMLVMFGFRKIKIKNISSDEFAKFYWKIFLISGVLFGLWFPIAFFIVQIIMGNIPHTYKEITFFISMGPITGFLFGASFANALGRQYIKLINKLPYYNITSIESIQIKNIEIEYDKIKCFDLCIEAITKINKNIIKQKDYDQGLIIAKTIRGKMNWGEIVEVNLKPIDENKTNINIKSQPISKLNIANCVNNIKNVEEIYEYLERARSV